jgi:hypothetical protein
VRGWLRSRDWAPDVREFRLHIAGVASRDVRDNRYHWWIFITGRVTGATSPSVQTIKNRPVCWVR